MNCKQSYSAAALFLAALGALGPWLSGCTTPRSAAIPATEQSSQVEPTGQDQKGGAQLWAERCSQCHYVRDPGTFSRAQWEVIMLHMRVRANLTATEHQAILEFLKSAN
jgi:hypothetical protein